MRLLPTIGKVFPLKQDYLPRPSLQSTRADIVLDSCWAQGIEEYFAN